MNKHLRRILRATSGPGPSIMPSGKAIVMGLIICLVLWVIGLFASYNSKLKLANTKASENYESILWIAVGDCSQEVVKSLVRKNLVNIHQGSGERLLEYATKKECLEVVQFLIEEKVDINSTSGSLNNRIVLHYAAEQGNLEVVKFLLQKGANPNAKEFRERKPRDLARGRVTVMLLNNENSNKPYREIIDLLDKAEKQYKPEQ